MRIEVPFVYRTERPDGSPRWHADVVRHDVPELSEADLDGRVTIARARGRTLSMSVGIDDPDGDGRPRLVHPVVGGRIMKPNDGFLWRELAGDRRTGTISTDDVLEGQATHAVFAPWYRSAPSLPSPERSDPGPEGEASRTFHHDRALSILRDLAFVGGRLFDGSVDPVSLVPADAPDAEEKGGRGGWTGWLDPRFGWRTTDAMENQRGSLAIPPFRTIDGIEPTPHGIVLLGGPSGFRTRLEEEAVNCAHAVRCAAVRLFGSVGILPGDGLRDLLPGIASATSRFADPTTPPPSPAAVAELLLELAERIRDPRIRGLDRYPASAREAMVREASVFGIYWRDRGADLAAGRTAATYAEEPEEAFSDFSM